MLPGHGWRCSSRRAEHPAKRAKAARSRAGALLGTSAPISNRPAVSRTSRSRQRVAPAKAGAHVAPDQKCRRISRETWMPAAAGMTGETETSLISTDPVDDYAAPNPTCERPRGPRRRIAAPTKPKPAIIIIQLAGSGIFVVIAE